MTIPRIVKYTLINLVKLTVFISAVTVAVMSIGFLIKFVELNNVSPFWVIVPIIVAAMVGFSVMVARFDVERDDLRDQRIANRLSRED